MHAYLNSSAGARRLGAPLRQLRRPHGRPRLPGGVPTLAIWGEGDPARQIAGAAQRPLPQQGAHRGDHLAGGVRRRSTSSSSARDPETRNVVPEKPKKVTVAGRAVAVPRQQRDRRRPARDLRGGQGHRQRRKGEPIESLTWPPTVRSARCGSTGASATSSRSPGRAPATRSTTTPSRSSAQTTSTGCSTRRRCARSSSRTRTTPSSPSPGCASSGATRAVRPPTTRWSINGTRGDQPDERAAGPAGARRVQLRQGVRRGHRPERLDLPRSTRSPS